jgi:histidyl-tRNA synthetase
MSQKPSLPKGMRDFGPLQMARRNYILDTIKSVFQKFGFMPLETPAMENLTTLTGKYGDEGDQLLFKVLDSGNYPKELNHLFNTNDAIKDALQSTIKTFIKELIENYNADDLNPAMIKQELSNRFENLLYSNSGYINHYLSEIQQHFSTQYDHLSSLISDFIFKINFSSTGLTENFDFHFEQFVHTTLNNDILPFYRLENVLKPTQITPHISSKGLKYDLTVPFARYVVMNQNDITFPFKRYQIQPVWRADRPQRGRYREFYQCDADVVGTDSLICEAEIVLMITEVFEKLKFTDYSIKINHRAVLTGMAEAIGAEEKTSDLFVAIDKLDKIGLDKVCEELLQRGLNQSSVDALKPLLSIEGSFEQKIGQLTEQLNSSESGKKGIEELQQINAYLDSFGLTDKSIELDTTLARGLSYYTGAIFEVKVNNVSIGSVSGGGRYDNLTGVFGLTGTSGVGFSFGIDRIYDCLEELNLFEEVTLNFTEVLITHFDEQTQRYGLSILKILRDAGIKSEIYPDQAKLKKQFGYADKKGIPYTITIGSEEMNSGLLSLKNMADGQQEKLDVKQIVKKIKGQ